METLSESIAETGAPVSWRETSAREIREIVPTVSVLMIVYNQESYLAEAIGSIVSQRCPFPFELVIGDDASADGSLQIALDYQRRFPSIVRVLHGGDNLGMNGNSRRVRSAARGDLLAWCEGDDYWCDNRKLAMQEAVLRADDSVGAVHTDWARSQFQWGRWRVDWGRTSHRGVPRQLLSGDLLPTFHNPLILRTCTLLFRRSIADQVDRSVFGQRDYDFGDAVTALFITAGHRVAHVPATMAVYRVSPQSALRSGVASRIRFLKSSLAFDEDARRFMRDDRRYPAAYRWELLVGLALWSCRARDLPSFKMALRGLWSDFSAGEFAGAAIRTIWMRRRWPASKSQMPPPAFRSGTP